MTTTRIDGLTLLTMDGPAADPVGSRHGSLRIRGTRIDAIGDLAPLPNESALDGRGLVALPGFVQGHLHFCQTLFRGLADDRALMPWLETRIWPLEAAHDAASVRASARLSLVELLRGGTTCVQVMESVRHAEETFVALRGLGMTAIAGNCLMDVGADRGPSNLATSTQEALEISDDLRRAFHHPSQGMHYAVSPRFVLSCSEELARSAAAYARQHGLHIHTHANEHAAEVELVRKRFSREYIQVLADQGLLGPKTGLAHCVHTNPHERDLIAASGTAVLHCPSANLKLGSGIAPIAEYAQRGIKVALGADGAACNNKLSALTELRQAALLQSLAVGPGRWPAAAALVAATLGGAQALGFSHELGSLTPGKRADVVLMDLCELEPGGDAVSKIVWSADERAILHVLIGGRFVVRDRHVLALDAKDVAAEAARERMRLLGRAGLAR